MAQNTHSTERTTCESRFSPTTIWDLGLELKSSGLLANAFIQWANSSATNRFSNYWLHSCYHINDFFFLPTMLILLKKEKEKGWKEEILEKDKWLALFRSTTNIHHEGKLIIYMIRLRNFLMNPSTHQEMLESPSLHRSWCPSSFFFYLILFLMMISFSWK